MFTDKPMTIYFVLHKDEVVYIGQTKLSLEARRSQHEYNAQKGKGYVIGAGIRKHGASAFTWYTHSVYYVQRDLDAAEKHLIAKYSPKYNINLGGESRGVRKSSGKPSWNKGKTLGPSWNKGKKEVRPEVLENIKKAAQSRTSNRKPITQEHKTALAKGRREKYRETNRKFVCNETKKEYVLVVDAAKDMGLKASGIYAVLNPQHKMKSYRGFTFSYL